MKLYVFGNLITDFVYINASLVLRAFDKNAQCCTKTKIGYRTTVTLLIRKVTINGFFKNSIELQ